MSDQATVSGRLPVLRHRPGHAPSGPVVIAPGSEMAGPMYSLSAPLAAIRPMAWLTGQVSHIAPSGPAVAEPGCSVRG